ncbi:23709_t:CDS:2, partial [Racocetra persica]
QLKVVKYNLNIVPSPKLDALVNRFCAARLRQDELLTNLIDLLQLASLTLNSPTQLSIIVAIKDSILRYIPKNIIEMSGPLNFD